MNYIQTLINQSSPCSISYKFQKVWHLGYIMFDHLPALIEGLWESQVLIANKYFSPTIKREYLQPPSLRFQSCTLPISHSSNSCSSNLTHFQSNLLLSNFQSHIFPISHISNFTVFPSHTLPILHSSNHTLFQSHTLSISHYSNLALFQSHTLPTSHSSHLTLFQSNTLPISHFF